MFHIVLINEENTCLLALIWPLKVIQLQAGGVHSFQTPLNKIKYLNLAGMETCYFSKHGNFIVNLKGIYFSRFYI